MISYGTIKTAELGELLLVANEKELLGIYFAGLKHSPAIGAEWELNPKQPILAKAGTELRQYLAGKRATFSVSLRCDGTPFQRAIWRQISRIPFGKTITYSELAKRVGAPKAIRAAGTATGRNPLSVIIPCHRVVGTNGGLGGYAGGLERKKRLLAMESGGL